MGMLIMFAFFFVFCNRMLEFYFTSIDWKKKIIAAYETKLKCWSKKECGAINMKAFAALSLTHCKIAIRHPPPPTAPTVETSICLSSCSTICFPQRQPHLILHCGLLWHWKRPLIKTFVFLSDAAQTGGWGLTPEGDIFVPIRASSPCPRKCFISTGLWWIHHLALIWRSGSPLPKCQVKSQVTAGQPWPLHKVPLPLMHVNIANMCVLSIVKWVRIPHTFFLISSMWKKNPAFWIPSSRSCFFFAGILRRHVILSINPLRHKKYTDTYLVSHSEHCYCFVSRWLVVVFCQERHSELLTLLTQFCVVAFLCNM